MLRGVTLKVNFSTFGDQALATLLATTTQNVAACLGGHSCAKSVLLLADAFGRLIRAFAHGVKRGTSSTVRLLGARTLGFHRVLSIRQWAEN